jgi:hypothetical protein
MFLREEYELRFYALMPKKLLHRNVTNPGNLKLLVCIFVCVSVCGLLESLLRKYRPLGATKHSVR